MQVTINREGICMGDDAIDHRKEITLPDSATPRDLMEKLLEMDYLPDQTGAVWYTGTLEHPCLVAYSCEEKKIVAEASGLPLASINDSQSYHFYHAWLKHDYELLQKKTCLEKAIHATQGIWYDREFFGKAL